MLLFELIFKQQQSKIAVIGSFLLKTTTAKV